MSLQPAPFNTNYYEFDVVKRQLYGLPAFENASTKEKQAFLEFCIHVLKADIVATTTVGLIGKDDPAEDPFPIGIFTPYKTEQMIDFTGKTVVFLPYDVHSLLYAVADVAKEGFIYEKNPTNGLFYEDINLLIVHDGRHHAAAASMFGGGQAKCDVFRLADVFNTVHTDGRQWFGTDKTCPVLDIRFALIYEFAQQKYLLGK